MRNASKKRLLDSGANRIAVGRLGTALLLVAVIILCARRALQLERFSALGPATLFLREPLREHSLGFG